MCGAALNGIQDRLQKTEDAPRRVKDDVGVLSLIIDGSLCTDKAALLHLWQVAIQCPGFLMPEACLPTSALSTYWLYMQDLTEKDLCERMEELHEALVSNWTLNGCAAPLHTVFHKRTFKFPASTPKPVQSGCDAAVAKCHESLLCGQELMAADSGTPAHKWESAIDLCDSPADMFDILDVYGKCPELFGGTHTCFDREVSMLLLEHKHAKDSICSSPHLTKSSQIHRCVSSTKAARHSPDTELEAVGDCPVAVQRCQAVQSCEIEYRRALQDDSHGRLRRVFGLRDEEGVQAMLNLAVACQDFLPCDYCISCKTLERTREMVRMLDPSILATAMHEIQEAMDRMNSPEDCRVIPAWSFDPHAKQNESKSRKL